MGKSVSNIIRAMEVEYFNQGEQQRLKQRNNDLAIERYTDAIFDEKSKVCPHPYPRNQRS